MALTALPLTAQTTTAPVHHAASATTAAHHAAPRCADPAPVISPKIPALPAAAPCVKVLYTETRIATSRLDYVSPLVSEEVRDAIAGGAATYSLDYVDTETGKGDLARQGKWLTVHYTGYLAMDGTKFDSSKDRGQPISFPYGAHQVIQGWDTGFEGMRIGGKRRLYIPYELAYGEAGKGPIPAKSELIFDVELISQSDTRPTPPPGTRPVMPPAGRPGMPPNGAAPRTPPPGTPPTGAANPPAGTGSQPAVTPPPGTTPGAATPPTGASTPPPTPPQGTSGSTPPPAGSSTPQPQR